MDGWENGTPHLGVAQERSKSILQNLLLLRFRGKNHYLEMQKFIRADVCFEYPNGSKSDPYITAGCGENDMVLWLHSAG